MQEGRTELPELEEPERVQVIEEEVIEDNGEATEAAPSEPDPRNETARETVKRVLEEEKAKANTDEDGARQEGGETKEAKGAPSKPDVKRGPGRPPLEDVAAPERFSAIEKELFNKLPKQLKPALARMVKEHEGKFTRTLQQYQSAANEARAVTEAIQPYLTKWGERGFTPSSAIAALAAAQEKLTNPETAVQAYLQLGQEIGLDTSRIAEAIGLEGGPNSQAADISSHPQFQALQQELNQLRSVVEPIQTEKFESTVNSITSDIEAVREEKDQFGRYLYPALHEPEFLQRAKPLVSALVRTIPGMSYGEAYRRAHDSFFGNSNQVNQARLPASDNQQTVVRQAPRAVSVRGRSAPAATSQTDEFPPEALKSPRDTVRWVLQQQANRRGV